MNYRAWPGYTDLVTSINLHVCFHASVQGLNERQKGSVITPSVAPVTQDLTLIRDTRTRVADAVATLSCTLAVGEFRSHERARHHDVEAWHYFCCTFLHFVPYIHFTTSHLRTFSSMCNEQFRMKKTLCRPLSLSKKDKGTMENAESLQVSTALSRCLSLPG